MWAWERWFGGGAPELGGGGWGQGGLSGGGSCQVVLISSVKSESWGGWGRWELSQLWAANCPDSPGAPGRSPCLWCRLSGSPWITPG